MFIPQAIRILGLTTVAFIAALMLTPTFLYLIERFKLSKNLRSEESAPIFFNLHKKKIGTPTMGGMIIWVTVLGLAFIFFLFSTVFDGFFSYLNFVNRAETYLPIAGITLRTLDVTAFESISKALVLFWDCNRWSSVVLFQA